MQAGKGISATGSLALTHQRERKGHWHLGWLEPSEPSNEVTNSPSGCGVRSQEVIQVLMEGRSQDNEQLLLLLSVWYCLQATHKQSEETISGLR